MPRMFLMFALCVGLAAQSAVAGPMISEIYFNPPGGNDSPATNSLEYIEIYDCPGGTLDNHYLIILENENDEFNSGNPGEIENIFDLSGMTVGSNGFLILAQRNTAYPAISGAFDIAVPANPAAPTKAESLKTLANGAHAYVNRDTGNGYGSGTTSSIGHTGQNTDLEGSGFTAMLIAVNPLLGGLAPVLNDDLDLDNDGLDVATGQTGWTILDSIGVIGEADETPHARLYGAVGFGPGTLGGSGSPGGVEPGSDYVNTAAELLEIEYVSRVGVGTSADNWLAANLTNDPASGFTNALRNYAISGNHTLQNDAEVYVGNTAQPAEYPYGTDMTVTFGENDALYCVPEPSSIVLLVLGGLGIVVSYRRRRSRR